MTKTKSKGAAGSKKRKNAKEQYRARVQKIADRIVRQRDAEVQKALGAVSQ